MDSGGNTCQRPYGLSIDFGNGEPWQACIIYKLPLYAVNLTVLCAIQFNRFQDYRGDHGADIYSIIIATSAVALSYNVVHSLMIQQTSAVTTTVLGEAKIVGLMLLSYLILGEGASLNLHQTRCNSQSCSLSHLSSKHCGQSK